MVLAKILVIAATLVISNGQYVQRQQQIPGIIYRQQQIPSTFTNPVYLNTAGNTSTHQYNYMLAQKPQTRKNLVAPVVVPIMENDPVQMVNLVRSKYLLTTQPPPVPTEPKIVPTIQTVPPTTTQITTTQPPITTVPPTTTTPITVSYEPPVSKDPNLHGQASVTDPTTVRPPCEPTTAAPPVCRTVCNNGWTSENIVAPSPTVTELPQDPFPPSDETLVSILNQLVTTLTAHNIAITQQLLTVRFQEAILHRYPLFDARIVSVLARYMVSQHFLNLVNINSHREPWSKYLNLRLTAHLPDGRVINLPPGLACLQDNSFITTGNRLRVPSDIITALDPGWRGFENFSANITDPNIPAFTVPQDPIGSTVPPPIAPVTEQPIPTPLNILPPSEPTTTAPIVIQPVTEPTTTGPIVIQPVTEPSTTGPIVIQPVTEPTTTAPIVIQPVTEQTTAAPVVIQPVTEPTTTGPVVIQTVTDPTPSLPPMLPTSIPTTVTPLPDILSSQYTETNLPSVSASFMPTETTLSSHIPSVETITPGPVPTSTEIVISSSSQTIVDPGTVTDHHQGTTDNSGNLSGSSSGNETWVAGSSCVGSSCGGSQHHVSIGNSGNLEGSSSGNETFVAGSSSCTGPLCGGSSTHHVSITNSGNFAGASSGNETWIAGTSTCTGPLCNGGSIQTVIPGQAVLHRRKRSALFGVDFSPYVRSDNYQHSDYTSDDVKTMLKIVGTKFRSVQTYDLGNAGEVNSSAMFYVGPAAAEINSGYGALTISVAQSARLVNVEGNTVQLELEAALESIRKANAIFPETVWALTLSVHPINGFVDSLKTAELYAREIVLIKERIQNQGVALGVAVENCGAIVGENQQEKEWLIEVGKTVDYFVCHIYPQVAVESGLVYFEKVKEYYETVTKAFQLQVPNLEIILATGLPSQGAFYRNPASSSEIQSIEKFKEFWESVERFSEEQSIGVFMHEAFNIPENKDESEMGYFMRSVDNRNRYFDKITGQSVKLIK